jgi:hypothetical protein
LRRLYADMAAELAELLPEVDRLHERLRAIHSQVEANFPNHSQRSKDKRPEYADELPLAAGLPPLLIAALCDT